MKLIVDQIHGKKALCETFNGTIVLIDTTLFDKTINEGDIIIYENGAWNLDSQSSHIRKKYVEKLISAVFEE